MRKKSKKLPPKSLAVLKLLKVNYNNFKVTENSMADTKILIIEDDPLISRMYEKIFRFENITAVMAHDGEEGIAKAKSEKPTLILLDIMMPKMNGLQVLDQLKAAAETKTIPVIVLTNLAGQNDAETALSKGAVKYIIKSEHEPKEIADMVKEVLAGYTRDQIPGSSTPTNEV
jgi:twitching motility two-component system response regulator PilH